MLISLTFLSTPLVRRKGGVLVATLLVVVLRVAFKPSSSSVCSKISLPRLVYVKEVSCNNAAVNREVALKLILLVLVLVVVLLAISFLSAYI
jgi:hypothetical protein